MAKSLVEQFENGEKKKAVVEDAMRVLDQEVLIRDDFRRFRRPGPGFIASIEIANPPLCRKGNRKGGPRKDHTTRQDQATAFSLLFLFGRQLLLHLLERSRRYVPPQFSCYFRR